jgi:hypothetical protein
MDPKPDWLERTLILAFIGILVALVGLAIFILSSFGSHVTSSPDWDDVDDAVEDWVVEIPRLGQPLSLTETIGVRGNSVLLTIRLPREEALEFLRALHIREELRPCPEASDAEAPRCETTTGFDSKHDGHKYPWMARVRLLHKDALASTFEIDAWQEYD